MGWLDWLFGKKPQKEEGQQRPQEPSSGEGQSAPPQGQ